MRSKLMLLTTAAALVFGLGATAALAEDTPGAKSDITIVKDDTGLATGKAGVQPNSPSQGAADENSAAMPDPNDRNGAGAQGGADDQGATGKSTEDLGAPPAEPPQKEGQLPSPSSSY
jgi:hypothetical protein